VSLKEGIYPTGGGAVSNKIGCSARRTVLSDLDDLHAEIDVLAKGVTSVREPLDPVCFYAPQPADQPDANRIPDTSRLNARINEARSKIRQLTSDLDRLLASVEL
jgi:outer membrane murein-binding lipoprotein Lpp